MVPNPSDEALRVGIRGHCRSRLRSCGPVGTAGALQIATRLSARAGCRVPHESRTGEDSPNGLAP
eukprot:12525117-Alexandrium_andersonii.AAC.1